MAYIYGDPDFWKARLGVNPNTVAPGDAIALEIYNQLYLLNTGGGAPLSGSIYFVAAAGDNSYTAAQVPTLSHLVGKTITLVTMAGGNIDLSLVTWDDVTFTLDPSITVDGGEFIVIFYQ